MLVVLTALSCVYGREKSHVLGGGDDDDIAGPVVKSHGTSGLSVVPISANVTLLSNATLSDEKKKTIAQIIDEALEQEFPEEKPEKIGKNYNETALQEDVSIHEHRSALSMCSRVSFLHLRGMADEQGLLTSRG